MNKVKAILYLYPNADPLVDFRVQDNSDGNGPYIAHWNIDAPQPTGEDLQAAWAAYELAEAAKPPVETDTQKIARLESEKAAQDEQIANINRDFGDFVDFFFANNPQLS